MNAHIVSFKMFVRNIFSDGMMTAVVIVPLLLGVALKVGFPIVLHHFPVVHDYNHYFVLLDLGVAILAPFMICFASVLVVLDEMDAQIHRFIAITPLGKRGYLISRFLIPILFATLFSVVLLLCCSVSGLSVLAIVVLSLLSTLQSVVISLIILSFAGNKVEGMALSKVSTLILLGMFVPYVLTDASQYIFSFLPPFWITKFLITLNYWCVVPAVVLSGIVIYVLSRRYVAKL